MNLLTMQQVNVLSYLTLASNGGQRLQSLRGHFYPGGIAPISFYKRGWVGPFRKPTNDSPVVQPVG
jgi:hypothetical protein